MKPDPGGGGGGGAGGIGGGRSDSGRDDTNGDLIVELLLLLADPAALPADSSRSISTSELSFSDETSIPSSMVLVGVAMVTDIPLAIPEAVMDRSRSMAALAAGGSIALRAMKFAASSAACCCRRASCRCRDGDVVR